ncbi:translation initiation factor eIF-2B subunit gamma [Quillaja saponaria]|uniref:Translation initiation factor eIF-2B subunit gamma n=1 Tax=Quillaja saponaria TaxID=32244 RepID=A0AAD7LV76_QUISA|nr:translation initiation factor eIF-2B subunit gamma [Quillaja saponaria]
MEIRDDLMDAHLYVFKISALQEVLDQKDTFHSLKQDVLPYLVRSQLDSSIRSLRISLWKLYISRRPF